MAAAREPCGGRGQPLRLGKRAKRRCRIPPPARGPALRARPVLQMPDISPAGKDTVLNLLAVEFSETDEPSGVVTLVFSGGAGVATRVECLEAELADLGPTWITAARPVHSLPRKNCRKPAAADGRGSSCTATMISVQNPAPQALRGARRLKIGTSVAY